MAIANRADYRTAVERAAALSDTAEGSEEACERDRLIKGMEAKRGEMAVARMRAELDRYAALRRT